MLFFLYCKYRGYDIEYSAAGLLAKTGHTLNQRIRFRKSDSQLQPKLDAKRRILFKRAIALSAAPAAAPEKKKQKT